LTQKAARRGAFVSFAAVQEAIERFLQAWNVAPRPFVWTATVEKMKAKVERARQKLEGIKPGWSLKKRRKKRSTYEASPRTSRSSCAADDHKKFLLRCQRSGGGAKRSRNEADSEASGR